MTAREQTGDRKLNRLILAYNDFTNLLRERVNVIGHWAMMCGNDDLRKHDMRKITRSSILAFARTPTLDLVTGVSPFVQISAFPFVPG
jgi:hypothetical protein